MFFVLLSIAIVYCVFYCCWISVNLYCIFILIVLFVCVFKLVWTSSNPIPNVLEHFHDLCFQHISDLAQYNTVQKTQPSNPCSSQYPIYWFLALYWARNWFKLVWTSSNWIPAVLEHVHDLCFQHISVLACYGTISKTHQSNPCSSQYPVYFRLIPWHIHVHVLKLVQTCSNPIPAVLEHFHDLWLQHVPVLADDIVQLVDHAPCIMLDAELQTRLLGATVGGVGGVVVMALLDKGFLRTLRWLIKNHATFTIQG